MKLLTILIASLFLNSCHLEISINHNKTVSPTSVSSTGILISSYSVNLEKFQRDCLTFYDESVCNNDHMILAIKTVNLQLAASFSSRSTTFSIQNEYNLPVMVTAGHVCEEFESFSNDVAQAMTSFNFGPLDQLTLEARKTILVYDIFGNKYLVKDTIYSHPDKPDICLFNIDRPFPSSIQLSNEEPVLGDNITNIAVPFGIFGIKTIPIFQGIYSGQKNKNNHVYTLPAGPGSSGSPVLLNNKLIGIIHSVDRRIHQISYGTPVNIIRNVLELE
tara:strand:- start:7398 stop:8222 length:825 start_codon:yes stop_codon:yes gene_type:complete